MILMIAPAKTFNEKQEKDEKHRPLLFEQQTQKLIEHLKGYTVEALQQWMNVSEAIAQENVERYKHFEDTPFRGYKALAAFSGEVYKNIDQETLPKEARAYLDDHLIILSGLYGVLRSTDCIKPYRLEMGTKFEDWVYKDLYQYWKAPLTDYVCQLLQKEEGEKVLINLASTEYSKVLNLKQIKQQYRVIDLSFKEEKTPGQYKVVGMYAKKARGQMLRYIACHKLQTSEAIKAYSEDGYQYNEALSSKDHYVFTRSSH